jgi:hypothetical protein
VHHENGVYDKKNPALMSPFNCDVGEYTATTIDDMGITSSEKMLVVNVSLESLTYPLWVQYLTTNETVANVYKNWTSMDMGDGKTLTDTCVNARNAIASTILGESVEPCYRDEVNALYTDGTSIYFGNHAVKTPKEEGAKVLLHSSALAGYETYLTNTSELFIPSNVGIATNTFEWNDMSMGQRGRIFKDCIWEGQEAFNTYVLRPPGLVSQAKKALERHYSLHDCNKLVMSKAKFSSQPTRDFMDINELEKLTPTAEHVKGFDVKGRSGASLEVKMSLEYAPFEKLIKNFEKLSKECPDFKLFNEKIVKDGYIKIPREILNKL